MEGDQAVRSRLQLSTRPSEKDDVPVTWKLWIFGLADRYRHTNSRIYLRLGFRDFVIFLAFLVFATALIVQVYTITFSFSYILRSELTKREIVLGEQMSTDLKKVGTVEELWVYIQTIASNVFVCEKKRGVRNGLYVFYAPMIGVPRLRQVRVRGNTCKVPKAFEKVLDQCYGSYSGSAEDRKFFGSGSGPAWEYSEDIAKSYAGKIATYGRGGYYFDFSQDCERSNAALKELRDAQWIDSGTRAVFLDFAVFSPGVQLLWVVKVVAELPPTGGIYTQTYIKCITLFINSKSEHTFLLVTEIIMATFIVYSFQKEVRKIISLRLNYFTIWNILDLIIVCLGIVGAHRTIWFYLNDQLPELVELINTDQHRNLDKLMKSQAIQDYVMSTWISMIWFQILKYLMLLRSVRQIMTALRNAISEVFALFFLLFVLLISFSMMGHILFGAVNQEFGTIVSSFVSLSMLLIGSLDLQDIIIHKPFVWTAFFIVFIFCYILLFMSLFIAILFNGFIALKYEILEDKDRLSLKQIYRKIQKLFFRIVRKKDKVLKIEQKELQDSLNDDFEVILNVLRSSGIRGREVQLFLGRSGLRRGEPISDELVFKMYKEIDALEHLFFETKEHKLLTNEIEMLKVRITYIEKMADDVLAKVELLIQTLTEYTKED